MLKNSRNSYCQTVVQNGVLCLERVKNIFWLVMDNLGSGTVKTRIKEPPNFGVRLAKVLKLG